MLTEECLVNVLGYHSVKLKTKQHPHHLFLNEHAVLASVMHGSAQQPPYFIQMFHWRSQRQRKTRESSRKICLCLLYSLSRQTTVYSVCFLHSHKKPEVQLAWEDFSFLFFISPSPQNPSLTPLLGSALCLILTVNVVSVTLLLNYTKKT